MICARVSLGNTTGARRMTSFVPVCEAAMNDQPGKSLVWTRSSQMCAPHESSSVSVEVATARLSEVRFLEVDPIMPA